MLLTHIEISKIQVDPRAVELVPESIARERIVLPARLVNGILHLLLPAEAALESSDTLECLRSILDRPFTHEFAVTNDLRPYVDLFYTAIYSEIANCSSALRFRCPKRWAELEPTDDVRIRLCDVCHTSVTFCTTVSELKRMAEMNECVAFLDPETQFDTLGLPESI
jgi:hypothetical protein